MATARAPSIDGRSDRWRRGGRLRLAIRVLAAATLGLSPAHADPTPASTSTDVLKEIDRELENPISSTWSLKVQSKTYLLEIESLHEHRAEEVVEFQPLIPIPLTDRLRLVSRPTVPLLDDKPYERHPGEIARVTAVGDIELPLALVPDAGPWLVGAGPTFVLPTAGSNQTGKGKWQAGPAGVLGYRSADWQAAVFAQQWWSFAGSGPRSDVSQLKAQYFLTGFLPHGWSIGMSPTIAVNWSASDGNRLTFPVGLGVGKTVDLPGHHAVGFALQVQYMPIHPDEFGQELNVQLSVTPRIAPLIQGPLFGVGH
jgi:hypothetical protein